MATTDASPIVVGVDGSATALHALDWAAARTARDKTPLLLACVVPKNVDTAIDEFTITPEPFIERGRRALRAARSRLQLSGHDDLVISEVLKAGKPSTVLLRLAAKGRLLVVGRRGLGRFAELRLGSTSISCAAESRLTPVVVIPADPPPPLGMGGCVVVGVDGSAHSRRALEFAFEEAVARDASLRAVAPEVSDRAGGRSRGARPSGPDIDRSRRRSRASRRGWPGARPVHGSVARICRGRCPAPRDLSGRHRP